MKWDYILSDDWNRVFLHESGHALMAVLEGIPCYGVFFQNDVKKACTLIQPLPNPSQYTHGQYLFLAAGSAAEMTKYSNPDFNGTRADRKLFGTASYPEGIAAAHKVLAGKSELLKLLHARITVNYKQAGSDFKRLTQCDKSIGNAVKKVGVLLSKIELYDITK